jgi:dihydroneopterin aldolase
MGTGGDDGEDLSGDSRGEDFHDAESVEPEPPGRGAGRGGRDPGLPFGEEDRPMGGQGGAEPPDEDDDADEDEEDDEGDGDGEALESVTIEITGLSLYTHHGVSAAEREVGQRLVFDLRLDLGEADATVTDQLEDTVDYGEVCQLVALIAQQRSHKTLERLCSTIADRLLADYELEGVWVKAAKPEPPIPLTVDEVSVEVWREAEQ